MIIKPGDKLHVITRRAFAEDIRRHFVGEVFGATEAAVLAKGYDFVLSTARNEFFRRPERRTRIVSLIDAGNVINVIPRDVNLDSLTYRYTDSHRLVVTDGDSFQLDINEFGSAQ